VMPAGATRTVKVTATRVAGKGRLVGFEGFGDRTAAETLKGARLLVRRDELPPAGDGEFYYDDLPGLPVRLPDGTTIGRVTSVFRGATDILVLDVDGREVLVPCVAGFVASVDGDAVVVEPAALEEPE
jgi:16S rRNA processing protein RimM